MPLETFFPYKLAVVAEAFSRQLVAVYGREYGLSREEWRFLFLLADAGSLDSLQLSQRTSLDKVQVSRAASRLQGKGFITRSILGSDRRLRKYAVTDTGRELFGKVFSEVEDRADEIFGVMDPDDLASLERGVAALGDAVSKVKAARDG
ncbi:MAG: MarR family winged helix-turn-helix transcriptional regulator [Paracoccus sp. (in: a-proteobacteria)]